MDKMKAISPHSLNGDLGWHLRDCYNSAMNDLDKFQRNTLSKWQSTICADLSQRLKFPLLVCIGVANISDNCIF